MSFNSKYTGQEVENLLDQVANGDVGGGISEETDPKFSASPAAGITGDNIQTWNSKQGELVSGINIKTINGQSILGSGDLAIGGGDSGIINPQMIYPQVEGNAYVYRIPSGVFCELFFNPNEAQASGIQYIVVVFDNPPEVSMNEDFTYNGDMSYAKYHFVVANYGCPIGFFIENVAETFIATNGGASIDTASFMFEMDALCNIVEFDGMRGGYIYGTSATYVQL